MGKKHTKRRSPSVMPIRTYIHEAWELLAAANHYRDELTSNGFQEETYALLEQKTLILRSAESELKVKCNTRTDNEKVWAEVSPKAFALRDTMLDRLRLALWNNSSPKLSILKKMKKNNSISCLIGDLCCLGSLWYNCSEELKMLNTDMTIGQEALFFGESLGRLHALAKYDRIDTRYRDARDAAFFDLRTTVDLIRTWAHILFKKGSREYQAFTSEFYRTRNAKAKARAEAKLKAQSLIDGKVTDRDTLEYVDTVPADSVAIVAVDEQANQAREYPLRLVGDDRAVGAA